MPILGQEKDSRLSQGGITQNNVAELSTSKLHKDYSITGNPNIIGKPSPSSLDLMTLQGVGLVVFLTLNQVYLKIHLRVNT